MQILNRFFVVLAGALWIATLGAVVWQVWVYFTQIGWPTLTVRMAYERLFGEMPTMTGDSFQVIWALISALSLVLFIGMCALACSALAKLVE